MIGWTILSSGRETLARPDAAATTLRPDLECLGTPPQLIWLRAGNGSNQEPERILKATLPTVLEMLAKGEPIVEVTGD